MNVCNSFLTLIAETAREEWTTDKEDLSPQALRASITTSSPSTAFLNDSDAIYTSHVSNLEVAKLETCSKSIEIKYSRIT